MESRRIRLRIEVVSTHNDKSKKYLFAVPEHCSTIDELLRAMLPVVGVNCAKVTLRDAEGYEAQGSQPIWIFDDMAKVQVVPLDNASEEFAPKPKSTTKRHFKYTDDGQMYCVDSDSRLDIAGTDSNRKRAKRASSYSFASSDVVDQADEALQKVEQGIDQFGTNYYAPRTLRSVGLSDQEDIVEETLSNVPSMAWEDVEVGMSIGFKTMELQQWTPTLSKLRKGRVVEKLEGGKVLRLVSGTETVRIPFSNMHNVETIDPLRKRVKKTSSLPEDVSEALEKAKADLLEYL